MLNIAIVTEKFGYGGAQKMHTLLANGLKKKGYEVSYICLDNKRNSFYKLDDNIKVYTIPFIINDKYKIGELRRIYFVYNCVKKHSFDILIGFSPLCNFYVTLVSKLLRVKSVISERTDPFSDYSECSFVTKFKIWFTNFADGAVFQTIGASKYYFKKLQKKSFIIPNPVFINGDIPVIDYKNRPKTVVCLGRFFNKQKRWDIAIKSFSIFHQSHPEYILKIYGSGQDEYLIKKNICKNNLSDCVKLMGISTNSLRDLAKEGIYLITSDYEGISNSLLEAMAVGMPLVSTDHSPGGARFLIRDHVNGLLTKCGDERCIANALSELADNPILAENCGMSAKNVLSLYTTSKTIELWDSYIKKISSF